MTLELICKSGHKSEHPKERVLRRNDAWCPKCGADVKHDPGKDAGALSKAARAWVDPSGARWLSPALIPGVIGQ